MSRLCCDDEGKAAGKDEELYFIGDEEIRQVVQEATKEKSDKPSTLELYERIDDLEFELECLRADAEETRKRRAALRRLVEVVDTKRFEKKNIVYVNAILKKIKQLVS